MRRVLTLMATIVFWPSLALSDPGDPGFAIMNHVSCYPRGLDAIGGGDDAAGIAIWNSCFAPDYGFKLELGWGAPTECRGDACRLPGDTAIEKRAAFARSIYDRAGFTRTHHSLANVSVAMTKDTAADVTAHVTAVHFAEGGAVTTGYGLWSVSLEMTDQGWRITDETLQIIGSQQTD